MRIFEIIGKRGLQRDLYRSDESSDTRGSRVVIHEEEMEDNNHGIRRESLAYKIRYTFQSSKLLTHVKKYIVFIMIFSVYDYLTIITEQELICSLESRRRRHPSVLKYVSVWIW